MRHYRVPHEHMKRTADVIKMMGEFTRRHGIMSHICEWNTKHKGNGFFLLPFQIDAEETGLTAASASDWRPPQHNSLYWRRPTLKFLSFLILHISFSTSNNNNKNGVDIRRESKQIWEINERTYDSLFIVCAWMRSHSHSSETKTFFPRFPMDEDVCVCVCALNAMPGRAYARRRMRRRDVNENLFDLRNVCSFISSMPTAAYTAAALPFNVPFCHLSIFGERGREFGIRH